MYYSKAKRLFPRMLILILATGLAQLGFAQIVNTSNTAQPQENQPAGAQQQAQPAGTPAICGNQPLCYESADFAATITHFRTSVVNNYHLIDVTMRFQNKTQKQLIVGYVVSSGIATDDRGNRSIVGGANGYHGIGLVAGNNFDPKFVVRPAGFGDAQFELVLQGWPQVIGFTYALDLSVAEINSFEGNQHTLGEEYPIHFDGLKNGAGATSPMFAGTSALGSAGNAISNPSEAISNPCATAGQLGQGAGQAAGQAAATVTNAANTISNLGSIFHHKKTQNAGQAAASAVGCDSTAAAGMTAPAAATTNAPATAVTPAMTNPLQQAVSRTAVPIPATNPLASTPAKPAISPTSAAQSSVLKTATTTAANAQSAATAHASVAIPGTTTKPSPAVRPTSAKPTPAKPVKPQPQGPQQPANQN
jgi:hypothetical protein